MRTNRTWLSGILLVTALFLTGCNLMETKAPDNQAITSDIQAKLFADPTLKHQDIRVSTDQGVVTLTGGSLDRTREGRRRENRRASTGRQAGCESVSCGLAISDDGPCARA